ncbi:hypothetical protein ACRRTK_003161 [Alexandromys fortis]
MLLILILTMACFHVCVSQDSDPEYADVVFLVDSSDHLGMKSFLLVRTFLTKLISSLPIEADKYRVALAQYSDALHNEFQLGTFKNRNPMLNHLKKNFQFIGGSLKIGNALQEAHRTYFSAPTNGRDKKLFPPILVVLASSESEDDVEEASKALREDGVKIISVGVQKASEENLKAMATSQFHFNLRTVRDLTCQGPSVADVVFLLDMAINGSQENLDHLKAFLEESVSALDIKENCMRVGLVAYSNETRVINSLSKGINKTEILQHIQDLSPLTGQAYTGNALRKTRKEVFSTQRGSRKNQGVPQIAVLVTHRASEDNVTKAAVNLRREGVTIFTMGIEGASQDQLEKIASHPAEQFASKLSDFSELATHNKTFLKKLRNQITHTVSVLSERTETLKSACVDTEEADIYLLIDGSGNTQPTDFHEMKTFLSDVVAMFNIAPHKDSVLEPAHRLREENIRVHAIGVKEANQTQLREIAGEEKRVYYVHEFDALRDIRNEVVQEICAEEACRDMKADIMFLVDSSGSIGPENFSKMKTFMKNLVSKSQIGADRVQIGVVQFSHENKEEFQLNTFMTQSDISSAIDQMTHIGETTLTGSALSFVSQYFSPSKGARPNVRKFLILITDGEAQDLVREPAAALRRDGVIIYSVGVFGSNVTQLEEISGKQEMVFYVENFDILQHIEDDLVLGICSPREECKRIEVLDVVFVIDSSGSIDYQEYSIMKDFMIGLVKKADVGKNQVRFGALKYADDPEVLFYLDDLGTKLEVISALQNDQPMGGNTYTAEALAFSDHMFTEARGSRLHKGVPQVLIVITDGESHDAEKLNATAKALRDKGILVLAVGIAGANSWELLAMAGSSDKYYFVETFGGLKGIFSDVSASVCNSSKVDCEIEKVDLVFLMDGSNSIHPNDFQKMKEFLASVVQDFDVSLNRVRIGVAQFSDSYRSEFLLGAFTGEKEISSQIESIQQIFGYTRIGDALRKVRHYFRPDTGSRINAGTPQVLLVLTDGRSQDEVAQAAEELRHKGVDIYSVGIGDVDDQQLIQITGTAEKKLTVHNFDELRKVKKRIVRNICTSGGESNCFVDVVVGFDISSQQRGQTLLEGQPWMEAYLQDILRAISSLNGVSCEVGTETQVSIAFQVTNAVERYPSKFEIYSDNILSSLQGVTVNGPSRLNTNLLSSLWDTFQNKSAARGKVVLLFSDGMDDDTEKLEQKSDELRKEGLNALITIAVDGAADTSDLADLLYIEFGKGFEYRTQFTIGMRNLGSQLSKQLGPPGFKGSDGYLGEEGIAGERGASGPMGEQGTKGCFGSKGPKGEVGENGIAGLNGEQGDSGIPGRRGEKGDEGSQGSPGKRGAAGDRGAKGLRGDPGIPGLDNDIQGPKGLKGDRGRQGRRGWLGSPGTPGSRRRTGNPGITGPDGLEGSPGLKGPQGEPGDPGDKGAAGFPGPRGLQGDDGSPGYGSIGRKGTKGQEGFPGEIGPKCQDFKFAFKPFTCCLEHDCKVNPFCFEVPAGRPGEPGSPGEPGPPGRKGIKGARGVASFSPAADVVSDRHLPYRMHCSSSKVPPPQVWKDEVKHEKPECPVHPTELVFVLDQSRDVTEQDFERMKGMMVSLVRDVKVRETSCPVGARVAILSYNSHARHVIRFSDTYRKDQLLREIEALPYERSSGSRDIGKAMRFISRNVFKRTLPGAHVRKIATFFSSGQSADAQSITTAAMEFSALDIVPVVIAFSNVPSIKRAFSIDDTGTFQVVVVPSGTDAAPALEQLQRCTFCYDPCKPDAACDQGKPPPAQSYLDAAFLLDGSRHVGSAEFEDMRGFLEALLDHFEVTPEPETSVTGDRVALLSHAPPNFLPHSQRSPVRSEFNLTTYSSKRLMKRHVEQAVQQLNGDTFLGHALGWALDNVFLNTPNLRRNKVIFVISAGETSHLDGDTLKKESLRAKCQGYALFVFSLGPDWNDKELEDLASHPVDQHLIQLGRIHKPDHGYGVKFVKSFINSVRRGMNKYPPVNFKAKCSRLSPPDSKLRPHQFQSSGVTHILR